VTLPPLPFPLLAESSVWKLVERDLRSGTAGVRSVFQQQGGFGKIQFRLGFLFKICFSERVLVPDILGAVVVV
jgi:hypothetical protein